MNNIRPSTGAQEFAANFLAEWFQSVLVGTPNQHGNQTLTALDQDEREVLKWIVAPDGQLLFRHYTNSESVRATTAYYLERQSNGPQTAKSS